MADRTETTDDEPQIEAQARAMHDAIAQKHGLPLWDEAGDEMRSQWLQTARVMHDPYNELLWGGDFDDRQEAELERKNQDSKLEYCANCGERHTEAAIAFAKLIGASTALCKKCTAIEKAKRGVSYD